MNSWGRLLGGGNNKEPLSCNSEYGLVSNGSWTTKTGDPRILDRGLSLTRRFWPNTKHDYLGNSKRHASTSILSGAMHTGVAVGNGVLDMNTYMQDPYNAHDKS
jgi:hypothetical protein